MSLTSTQRGSQLERPFRVPMQRDSRRPHLPPMQIDDHQCNVQIRQQRQHPEQTGSQEYRPPSNHPTIQEQSRQGGHRTRKGVREWIRNVAVGFATACCSVIWTFVILAGLAVLIVYLTYRPKSPLLDIQSATLNAAYLDTGTLLNADITILANFSNPNSKVAVAFSYMQLDLYFMGTAVATQAVEPFAERPGESALKSLHMIASEVPLPREAAEEWQRGTSEEGVALELAGRFRTRWDFGKWLHLTFWLYGRCTVVIGAPPGGVLLSSRCRTKR